MRVSAVPPFALPHLTEAPVTVGDFVIPQDSLVIANLSFIMKDPEHFPSPHTFKPERFLTSKGRFIKDERLIPFGLGRRSCIGEELARNQIFLFLGSLLQQLRFLPPDNHPAPNPENCNAKYIRIPEDFYFKAEKINY